MSAFPPTPRQLELLRFITRHTEANGVAPSFAEMALGIGITNRSCIHRLLTGLEERGLIRRIPNRARCIEVLVPSAGLDPADEQLLADLLEATAEPFADPVCVQGNWITRRLAKHMERLLLRQRVAERRERRAA